MRDIPLRPNAAEVDPGMPGLPLTEQRNPLGLVNADEIGVRLTASGVLVPPQIDLHGHRWMAANDKVGTH